MNTKVRRVFLLVLAVLMLTSSIHAQQPNLKTENIFGTYSHSGAYAGSSITIEPEGRFHINSSDCTQQYFEAGTYTFNGGILSLVTKKSTVRSHGESKDQAQDLMDPKTYKEVFRSDPPARRQPQKLVPVKWDERLYLLSEDSLIEFCNAINFGVEPRKSLSSDAYLGSFYLRNGDENKPTRGHPSFSNNLIALLLNKPIEAEIINIEFEGNLQIAVINKGSQAGLKPGMRFVLTEPRFWQDPSLWSGLVVISVTDDLARLKVFEEMKIGDKVSTKFVDRRYQSDR